jgi:hypothetical protein
MFQLLRRAEPGKAGPDDDHIITWEDFSGRVDCRMKPLPDRDRTSPALR